MHIDTDRSRHKLKRQSLPETLAASLKERILNGEFKDGAPLVQETLAEEYEVSRMPVREALRQLEAAGLIVMKTHKGAIVTSIPVEQIGELFELRALIECDALEYAIPKTTASDLAASLAVLIELEEAYRKRDAAKWGALNSQYHYSLYLPSNRQQTLSVVQGISVQTERYIRLHLQLTSAFTNAETDHRELLRLCEKRQVRQAVSFLRNHILSAGEELAQALGRDRLNVATEAKHPRRARRPMSASST